MGRSQPMLHSAPQLTANPLNSTCLKWGDDGELCELDLARIIDLLSRVDPLAEALVSERSEPFS